MPKSVPMPTNNTAKATEIKLSAPTIMSPTAAVAARPATTLKATARTIRADFKALQTIKRTIKAVTAALRPAPSATFANSSSAIGTRPVNLTVTPDLGEIPRSPALWRMKSDALSPGINAA